MPGTTPILTLPYPLGDDPIFTSDDTIRAAITGIEGSIVLGSDTRTADELPERYPKCASVMQLSSSGASDGGWPYGSGAIFTVRRASGDVAWQIYFSGSIEGGPNARLRIGGSSGWGGWERILAAGLAKAEAAGTVTATTTDTEQHSSVPVLFPGGRFSSPPDVLLSLKDTTATGEFWGQVENITADGFTAHFYRSTAGAIRATWYAVGGIG